MQVFLSFALIQELSSTGRYLAISLTLCILIDFPIPIDTVSMGLSIVHFKGSQVEFSKLRCISFPDDCFNFSKQCRP